MPNTWQESLEAVDALKALDGPDVLDVSKTMFFSLDEPTPDVVLIFHGFTNSPIQWREIAAAYHADGANVLVPRLPFHGLADPFNREMSGLTAQVLEEFARSAVRAAEGLGESLSVVGLSLGGSLAAYSARDFDSVRRAYLIAPFFQPKAVPLWIDRPFDAAMSALPDVYNWWNPKDKEAEVRGTYAYPKFSLKAVAAQIDFRRRLERARVERTDKAELVRLIINEADIAIRNDVACDVTHELFDSIAEKVEVEVVPGSLGLTHDMVEPNGSNRDKMDVVRSTLWPLIGLSAPEPGSYPDVVPPGGGYFADGAAVSDPAE